ncbi:HAD family hydrolase [Chitinophagaceae bacterium LB-8]|uniref:D,D-heptose 1,7-bisphosphate phosphatase n=1 Tax=Paraflavisolibacter caeni TaxID=2982496 RepID=A0A9X2XMT4_9BACT|nr:HAD family hydrolase [Paraflavisolibacter caeni]MCU7547918.1 HAD family hydrolase [Paraflavisolibacter caeni]
MTSGKNKAIFIDKDGTLIPDIPYNVDPEKISLQEGALAGLLQLQEAGYLLIIVSNQSGVARGLFKEEALLHVQHKIETLLAEKGVVLNGFYYCPHYPNAAIKEYAIACDCRKPQPGMLLKAARELDIDLSQSWMIGDMLNDVEAGKKAGCKTVLIDNGNEKDYLVNEVRTPDYNAQNIEEAAIQILKHVKV